MLCALLATSAAAYAPALAVQRTAAVRGSTARMALSDLPGVSTETGNVVWDPLNLAENFDEDNLNLVRAAELKHGRIAMLACVGWVWTATGAHFEGYISPSAKLTFASLAELDPLTALSKVPGAGLAQMVFVLGGLEIYWENKYPATKCAGNMGVPAVTQDPAKLKELATIELKHGRLAMIGIISFACAQGLPGSVPFYPF